MARSRKARVTDIDAIARALPHVEVSGDADYPEYRVGGKLFILVRPPRPDAVDPETDEQYKDVVILWVADESDKSALVQDSSSPYFTTPHFDGHRSVLLRTSRIGELTFNELAEVVQDGWLSRASTRRRDAWLADNRLD